MFKTIGFFLIFWEFWIFCWLNKIQLMINKCFSCLISSKLNIIETKRYKNNFCCSSWSFWPLVKLIKSWIKIRSVWFWVLFTIKSFTILKTFLSFWCSFRVMSTDTSSIERISGFEYQKTWSSKKESIPLGLKQRLSFLSLKVRRFSFCTFYRSFSCKTITLLSPIIISRFVLSFVLKVEVKFLNRF